MIQIKRIVLVILIVVVTLAAAEQQIHPPEESDKPEFSETLDETSNSNTITRQNVFPISFYEIFGFMILMLIAGLANAGGLGGGQILSPILIIIFNYSEKHAIELVYALVFGGSIGNFLNVVFRRDEKTRKPLIDYNLGLICLPFMILGASFGVVLNRMLAPVITLVGILGATLFSLLKIHSKARKIYEEESKVNEDKEIAQIDSSASVCSTFIGSPEGSNQENTDWRLKEILEQERQLFPLKKILMSIILISCIVLLAVIRGTKNFSSIAGISYCGGIYWGLLAAIVIICCSVLYINWRILKAPIQIKQMNNITSTKDSFELSKVHISKLLFLSSIAGILSGLLGIGGGTVMSPTLISIGVPARSLAATSGFLVLQTSFISMFQSILYRDVPLSNLGLFFLVTTVGSYTISNILTWLVKRYKRPSFVLFTLVIVLGFSLLTLPIFEIVRNIDDLGSLLAFSSVC